MNLIRLPGCSCAVGLGVLQKLCGKVAAVGIFGDGKLRALRCHAHREVGIKGCGTRDIPRPELVAMARAGICGGNTR